MLAEAGGCFSPNIDVPDCTIPCEPACPAGLACRDGYCANPNTLRCVPSDAGPDGPAAPQFDDSQIRPGDAVNEMDRSETPIRDASDGGTPEGSANEASLPAEVGAYDGPDDAGRSVDADAPYERGDEGADAGDGQRDAAPPVCRNCSVTTPPTPCRDKPYDATLTISGGLPPYRWTTLAVPDGLRLQVDTDNPDMNRVHLVGTPTGRTSELSLLVKDAGDRGTNVAQALVPRDKCWLAYLSLETSSPALHILDPLLNTTLPVVGNNQGVADFQFSPDGQYLAYRFGVNPVNPSSGHLAIIDMRTAQQQALGFSEDAVNQYAWSSDSSVLAVAFQAGGITYLGGARVIAGSGGNEDASAAVGMQNPAVDGGVTGISLLTAIPAPVQSEFVWFGTGMLGFAGPAMEPDPNDPEGFIPNLAFRMTYYTNVSVDRFVLPTMIDAWEYPPPVRFAASPGGFFASSVQGNRLAFEYFIGSEYEWQELHDTNVIAPSGAFTAGLSGDVLALYRAADGVSATPAAANNGCPQMLAWAKDRERVACVADSPNPTLGETHSDVHIFDLNAATNDLPMTVVRGACVKSTGPLPNADPCGILEYDYTQQKANGQRRALSETGRWLAFATSATPAFPFDNYVYLADLATEPMQLYRKDGFSTPITGTDVARVELAFSPDERMLIEHRGNLIAVHDLTSGPNDPSRAGTHLIGSGLRPPTQCSEDFFSAPQRWCGNVHNDAEFAWSSDSRLVAFDTDAGLRVVDLGSFPAFTPVDWPIQPCAGECSSRPVFQP